MQKYMKYEIFEIKRLLWRFMEETSFYLGFILLIILLSLKN